MGKRADKVRALGHPRLIDRYIRHAEEVFVHPGRRVKSRDRSRKMGQPEAFPWPWLPEIFPGASRLFVPQTSAQLTKNILRNTSRGAVIH